MFVLQYIAKKGNKLKKKKLGIDCVIDLFMTLKKLVVACIASLKQNAFSLSCLQSWATDGVGRIRVDVFKKWAVLDHAQFVNKVNWTRLLI